MRGVLAVLEEDIHWYQTECVRVMKWGWKRGRLSISISFDSGSSFRV